jgi:hypothetical protein
MALTPTASQVDVFDLATKTFLLISFMSSSPMLIIIVGPFKLKDLVSALRPSRWTDMEEFITLYGPANLNTSDWLTPEHVDELHSSIEDYNRFCTEIIQQFDAALMDENMPVQDAISDFLDELYGVMNSWLGDSPFMIFPGPFEDQDEISPKVAESITKSFNDFYEGIPLEPETLEAEVLPDIIEPALPFFRRTLRVNRAFTPSRMRGHTRHAVRRKPAPLE